MAPLLAEEENYEVENNVFGESEEQPNFEITDLESLTWAFRKLSHYQSKKSEKQDLANKERERIKNELSRVDAWEKEELKSINNDIGYFEMIIQQYHSKVMSDDPNQKTLSTPYGKSKSTTSKAQPEKVDEQATIKFVEENELPFVEKVPKLLWGELKKKLKVVEKEGKQIVIDENGQTVPGVAVKPQTTTFKVEI